MKTVNIHPLDTLLFRDTRPFEGDIDGLAQARSQFPPLPSVTAGALRAAIARAHGWRGAGNWKKAGLDPDRQAVLNSLGDGPWDTGHWRFGPPLVCRFGDDGGREVLYPCPAHVLQHGDTKRFVLGALSVPDKRSITTDLGATGLSRFAFAADGNALNYKSCFGSYLSADDMQGVVNGQPPTAVIKAEHIFRSQERMGIWLDTERRTAINARLYVAAQTRLADSATHHFGLRVGFGHVAKGDEGRLLDGGLKVMKTGVLPLGGGGRAAFAQIPANYSKCSVDIPKKLNSNFAMIFLSPAIVSQADLQIDKPPFGISDAKVVSVSSGGAVLFSPWSFSAGSRDMAHYLLEAGTIVFLSGASDKLIQSAKKLAAPFKDYYALGVHTNLGFGAFLFASWPKTK